MADRTLLEMVNSVRYKLRSGDPLSTLPTDEAEIETIVGFINEAARDILEGRDWSFDRRQGQLFTTKRLTGTEFTWSTGPATVLNKGCSIESTEASVPLTNFEITAGGRKSRIVVSDSDTPNTAYGINTVAGGVGRLTLVLDEYYMGGVATGDGTWTIYSHEYLLGSDVRKVLSFRDQENPLRLEFVERDITYDQFVPRPHDSYSDLAQIAYVLPMLSNSSTQENIGAIGTGTPTTGLAVMVWPIPITKKTFQFTHMVLHSALSSATATGTFPRVPENVIHVIEWRAVHMALAGPEKDAGQASVVSQLVREKLSAAIRSDERMPTRRLIPNSFGGASRRGYRDRWASQLVPSP